MSVSYDFTGKTVLVTGASRGIGRAIAEHFAKAGATVIGTATSARGVDAIQSYLPSERGEAFALDVSAPDSIEACLTAIQTKFATIDVLVNNAGITRDNLMLRMKDEDWQDTIATNLTSVFRLSKKVLRPMMKQRFGRIINIGSVVGSQGNAGQANYCAAKAGLLGFTKSLAQEVAARQITVNTIAPGFIETDMTSQLSDTQKAQITDQIPMATLGQSEDIAQAALFLASDAAAYITGETLHINGGMYMA